MKTTKLQLNFAKKREAEQLKIEKTNALHQYYDIWGRITSRYENWTAPEYYKQADENFNKSKELKQKEDNLAVRRIKLKTLMDKENSEQLIQVKDLEHPKSKQYSNKVLNGVHETIIRTEEEKRRLERESQLYKQWRGGFAENSILLESKSDHEALAKMNWLDRKVNDQMERERELRENEERHLRFQEQSNKHEELLNQRQQLLDDEIKKLQLFLDTNVNELKDREKENQNLIKEMNLLNQRKFKIADELESIDSKSMRRNKDGTMNVPHNTGRIKMLLRNRTNKIIQEIADDIASICRIEAGGSGDHISLAKDKFELQYQKEVQRQSHIEPMYESEAKNLLTKQESQWFEDSVERQELLKNVIAKELEQIDQQTDLCRQKQRELIEIKEKHLTAIENVNSNLKNLLAKQGNNSKSDDCTDAFKLNAIEENISKLFVQDKAAAANVEHNKITIGYQCNEKLLSPRFGKKKIAWD